MQLRPAWDKMKFLLGTFTFLFLTVISFQNCQKFEAREAQAVDMSSQEVDALGSYERTPLASIDFSCLPSSLQAPPTMSAHIKTTLLYMIDESGGDIARWRDSINPSKVGHIGNTMLVDFHPGDEQFFIEKMNYVRQIGRKALIFSGPIFFSNEQNAANEKYVIFNPNYREEWKKFKNIIQQHHFESVIAGWYVFDEPYWNARLKTVRQPGGALLTMNSMKDILEKASGLIKEDFPQPIAFIEAYPLINQDLQIPLGYSWIGMDCYGNFDNCGDDTNGRKSIPQYYEILKSKISADQRLVLVPDGFELFNESNPIRRDLSVAENAKKFFEYASREPKVVGIVGFLWNVLNEGEPKRGIEKLCATRALYHSYFEKSPNPYR